MIVGAHKDTRSKPWRQLKIIAVADSDSTHTHQNQNNSHILLKNKSFFSTLNLLDAGFEYLPRDFTISTNNGNYLFNTQILQLISPAISKQLRENPTLREFHIDVNDPLNITKKFEDILRLSKVNVSKSDLSVLNEIAFHLALQEFPFYKDFDITITHINVQIDMDSLKDCLRNRTQNPIKILSNNRQYNCNPIGIYSSNLLKEILQKDPTIQKLQYDLDEGEDFSIIQNLFNYQVVQIDANNIEFIEKMCDRLQIECIRDKIEQFTQIYNHTFDSIDNQQNLIDSVNTLFKSLYSIDSLTPTKVCEYLLESEWVRTEANVIEMVSCFLQVMRTNIRLHPYLLEFVFLLEKNANQTNSLNIFLPFLKQQLLYKMNESPHYCAFLYKLYERKVITFDLIYERMQSEFKQLKEIESSKWFPFFKPEFKEYIENHTSELSRLKKIYHAFDYDIDEYNSFRENFEPANGLLRLILHDDHEELQAALLREKIDINASIPPDCLYFPNFMLNCNEINFNSASRIQSISSIVKGEPLTLIRFAAQNGSINCFKYLLLNHAEFTPSLLFYSVIGGNLEIVRIAHQKVMEHIQVERPDLMEKSRRSLFKDALIQAIRYHHYSIFDWLLSQTTHSLSDVLDNLVFCSLENGNIQATIDLMNKDLDIPTYLKADLKHAFCLLSYNGYISYIKIVLSLLNKPNIGLNLINLDRIVQSQNSSILHLIKDAPIDQILYSAIRHGCSYLVDYIFKHFHYYNDKFDYYNLYFNSVQHYSNEMYKRITSKMPLESSKPYLSLSQYMRILEMACPRFNLGPIKELTELVQSIDKTVDFTMAFLHSANNFDICDYFINQNVHLDLGRIVDSFSCFSESKSTILFKLFSKTDKVNQINFFYAFLVKFIENYEAENVSLLLKMDIQDPAIHSILHKRSNASPFLTAIRYSDLDIINSFIEYFGEEISNQTNQINSGLRLILSDIQIEERSREHLIRNPFTAQQIDNGKQKIKTSFLIFKRLYEVVPNLDMTISFGHKTFLSLAIENSNADFITFYLKHLYDYSIFNDLSPNSPLIIAIRAQDLNVINLFIDILGPEIKQYTETIISGLKLLLNDFLARTTRYSSESTRQILTKLSETFNIDFNVTDHEESFMTFAIDISNKDFTLFCLENMQKRGQLNEVSPLSPLVFAMIHFKYQMIDLIIDFLGKDITTQTKQINLAFQLLVNSFKAPDSPSPVPHYQSADKWCSNLVRKFVEIDNFDLHSLPVVDYLLQFSIKQSDVDFIKLYLNSLSDILALKKTTTKSLLVEIIQSQNVQLLSTFITIVGEHMKDFTEQIELGLQMLLDNYANFKLDNRGVSSSLTKIIQAISGVIPIHFDSNPIFTSFFTNAIRLGDKDFVDFYLNKITNPAVLDGKSPQSPFVMALRQLNCGIIDSFIAFFNTSLDKHKDQIDLAMQLILEDLYAAFYDQTSVNPNLRNIPSNRSIQTNLDTICNVIHRLYEFVYFDLNYCYENETFITIAISNSHSRLVELYLYHLKNPSILQQKTLKSPFIYAIKQQQLAIIDIFIRYFGDSIASYKDQIEIGLKSIFDGFRQINPTLLMSVIQRFVRSANIDMNKKYGKETFLSIAVKNQDLTFIKLFLETIPSNTNLEEPSINSPLVLAIRNQNPQIIYLFFHYYNANLSNYVVQINLGLQFILEDLFTLCQRVALISLSQSSNRQDNSIEFFFKGLTNTIKLLSEIPNCAIDWNCSYQDETFLTLATKHSEIDFANFYLETIKKQAFTTKLNCSPLAYAIRQLKIDFLVSFINYYGDQITSQLEQINLGLYLVLQDFYVKYGLDKPKSSHPTSMKYELVAVRNIIKQLSKLISIDLNFSYNNETFLTFAIRNSDVDFVKFYLENLTDDSISREQMIKSSFIYAIREQNLEIINLFLEHLGDNISTLSTQINCGLRLLLEQLYSTIIIDNKPKDIQKFYSVVAYTFNKVVERLSEFTTIDFDYSYHNETFLTLAVTMSNTEFIKFYLENCKDLSLLKRKSATSPLVNSIQARNFEILNLLIDFMGDSVSDYQDPIEFGLEILLKNNICDFSSQSPTELKPLYDFLKRISTLITVDLNRKVNNETLVTIAIKNQDIDFITSYLANLKDKSIFNECSESSPLVCAIKTLQLNMINLFLDYFGQDIANYIEQINYAFHLILIDLCTKQADASNQSKNTRSNQFGQFVRNPQPALSQPMASFLSKYTNSSTNKSDLTYSTPAKSSTRNGFTEIQNVMERFSGIADIDFNSTYKDETFLTQAIKQSQPNFIKFYIQFTKRGSISHQTSKVSPMVYAISQNNFDAINVLIDFYGDEIKNLTEQIHYGLQLLLESYIKSGQLSPTSNQFSFGSQLPQSQFSSSAPKTFSEVFRIIKRLSEVAEINLNCSYQNETFLSIAIKNYEMAFIDFYLHNCKDHILFYDKSSQSPFVFAILGQNMDIIELLINYFGDKITSQNEQIILGLEKLLQNFSTNKKLSSSTKIMDIFKRFSQVTDLNLIDSTSFLNHAIESSELDFIKFFLEHVTDKSIFQEISPNSPFVIAIKNMNMDVIDLFINFFGDDIVNQTEQINFAIALILKNFYVQYDPLFSPLKKQFNDNCAFASFNPVVKKLSKFVKLDLNIISGNDTFLTHAIRYNNNEFIDFYFKYQKEISIPCNKLNQSPIVFAIQKHNTKLLNLFIEDISNHMEEVELGLELLFDELRSLKTQMQQFASINSQKEAALIIQKLLEVAPCDLNKYYNNDTYLTMAVQNSLNGLAHILIQNETVDINLIEQLTGNSPLMLAIQAGNNEIAQTLIECPRVDLKITNYNNNTALTLALSSKNSSLFSHLRPKLLKNADQDQINFAFYVSDDEKAQLLIESPGLNVNYRAIDYLLSQTDLTFESALLHSLRLKQFIKAELIISHPQFDPIQSNANSAIFLSVKHHNYKIFNALLKYVDVNLLNSESQSLFEYCCMRNFSQAIDCIINNEKFDPHKSHFTSVIFNMLEGPEGNYGDSFNVESIKKLILFDKNHWQQIHFDQLLPNGQSFFTHIEMSKPANTAVDSLHHSLSAQTVKKDVSYPLFIRFLLDEGVDPNKPDLFGVYPLQYAILKRNFHVVDALIQSRKIDYSIRTINSKAIANGTYLHLAAFTSLEIVQKLVSLQVFDLNMKDDLQQTPITIASKESEQIECQHPQNSNVIQIVKYLEQCNQK